MAIFNFFFWNFVANFKFFYGKFEIFYDNFEYFYSKYKTFIATFNFIVHFKLQKLFAILNCLLSVIYIFPDLKVVLRRLQPLHDFAKYIEKHSLLIKYKNFSFKQYSKFIKKKLQISLSIFHQVHKLPIQVYLNIQ